MTVMVESISESMDRGRVILDAPNQTSETIGEIELPDGVYSVGLTIEMSLDALAQHFPEASRGTCYKLTFTEVPPPSPDNGEDT